MIAFHLLGGVGGFQCLVAGWLGMIVNCICSFIIRNILVAVMKLDLVW